MRALSGRLALLLPLCAALLQTSSRPPVQQADLFRIPVQTAAADDPAWRDGAGRAYFHRQGITFPFAASGRRLSFTSPFSGTINISLAIWAKHDGRARLLPAGSGRCSVHSGQAELRPGLNTIRFSCNVSRDEKISIACSTACVFSQPLVYRVINAKKRRNIFLVSADNLGAGHMSCYGYPLKTTPRVDDFCRDALRVQYAFTNSPWTLPAHMSLFTSLEETEHGVTFKIENEAAVVLQGAVARLKVFPLDTSLPFLIENLAVDFPAFSFNGGINVASTYGFFRGFELYAENPDDFTAENASAQLFQKAQAHLLDHPLPAAFYFLHTYHVHLPYRPGRRALAEISPHNTLTRFEYEKDLGGIRNIFRPMEQLASEEVRALYDAEVLEFDKEFGKFIDFLKSQELYDSALIVLCSDHGEEFLEHGSWAHGTNLYNTQLRVPLIIKFPQREYAGRVLTGNASLMDILPTILDYLGQPTQTKCSGISLLGEFSSGPDPDKYITASLLRCKHWSALPAKAALIQGSYKLICNLPAAPEAGIIFHHQPPSFPRYQLFDLRGAGTEKEDILPQNRRLFEKMAAHLSRSLRASFKMMRPATSRPEQSQGNQTERLRALGYLQ